MKRIMFYMILSYLLFKNIMPVSIDLHNESIFSDSDNNFYEERTTFNKKHSIEIIEFKRSLNNSN